MGKNFKSRKAFLNYLGFGHATGIFKKGSKKQSITIRGKPKKVKHKKKR